MPHPLVLSGTVAAAIWLVVALVFDIRTQRIPVLFNLAGSLLICSLATTCAVMSMDSVIDNPMMSASEAQGEPPSRSFTFWAHLLGIHHPILCVMAGAATWVGLYLLVCFLSLVRSRSAGIGGADLIAAPAAGAVAALTGPVGLWGALLITQLAHVLWMAASRLATGSVHQAHLPAMTMGVAAAVSLWGTPCVHGPP